MSNTKLCVMGMYSLFLAEKIDRARMYASEKNVEYLLLDVLKHYIDIFEHDGHYPGGLLHLVLETGGELLASYIGSKKKHKPMAELVEIIDAYVVFCKHGLFLKEEIVGILKKFYKITLDKI